MSVGDPKPVSAAKANSSKNRKPSGRTAALDSACESGDLVKTLMGYRL